MGRRCWDYHHSTLDTGNTTTVLQKKKTNKRETKCESVHQKARIFSVLDSSLEFRRFEVSKRRIFLFYFSIKITLNGA